MGPIFFDYWALPFPLSAKDKERCYRSFHKVYWDRLNLRLTVEQGKEFQGSCIIEQGKPLCDAVIQLRDMPVEIQRIARDELREFLFDSGENPGPPFIYEYAPFTSLIRKWSSEDSGDEGLRNMDKLYKRIRKGILKRQGRANARDTITKAHERYRDMAIEQLEPLIKLVHGRMKQYEGLDQSVVFPHIVLLFEEEIKAHPADYFTVSDENNFPFLRKFLERKLAEGVFLNTCTLSVTDFVDEFMAFCMKRPAEQVRRWKGRDRRKIRKLVKNTL